jgi:uncharacterized membrane protein YeaQ/YmgE (transglycosylase-associated protein family)
VPRQCYKSRLAESGSLNFALKRFPLTSDTAANQQNYKIEEGKMGILMWILVGLVAGWLTGKIMKGSGYGFFVDILLGIAGALIGGFLASHLGLDAHGGFLYSTLIAVAGAVILVAILRLMKRA